MSEKLMYLCDKTSLLEDFHPQEIGWMDDIEPLDEFFLWLKNCVTNQNCITPEELKTHKVLLESGRFEDEEEKFVTNNYTVETIDVYPHSNDLELLESLYRQNQMRLVNHEDFFKIIKTEEKTVAYSKLGFKVDQMLDTEFRKVNSLIAGDYRRSALGLAAKCSQLNENLENISESVNSDLVCLSPMSTFCDLMEYLHLYITSSIEAFQGKFKKQPSPPMDGSSCGNLNSTRNLDDNLQRVFDDCVHLKASCVEIQSQMEGITEICNALDRSDLFAVIPSSDQADAATSEDLFMVCYDSVKAAFLNYEVKYKTDKQIKRRKILAYLENLRRIARPLKLCGDSVCLMIKDEFKWIRMTRAILSDVLRGLEEIQHQIEQSCKQLVNIRAVHELSSSASHTYPEIPSISLKFFESRCDISAISHNDTASSVGSNLLSDCFEKKIVENVMSRMHAGRLDSAFRMIKCFSEDVINSLSYSKTVYCRIFNGPSATMYLESDLISSIVRISRELKTKKDELEKLDCRRFEIEIHRKNNERRCLMEKLWLLYLQNPLQLRQIVEQFETWGDPFHH